MERYRSCMILSGVGDALGFYNSIWEFCRQGAIIQGQVEDRGGVEKLNIKKFKVSDDTVMHLATADALVTDWKKSAEPKETLYLSLAKHYRECMRDMAGRSPGNTCKIATAKLRPLVPKGYVIPFNPRGGGCGAAMRAVPIGLYFSDPSQLDDLIAVAIESGRMTHNHPTGFLGSLAVALFVSYAIQGKPPVEWGASLVDSVLDKAMKYIEEVGRDVDSIKAEWGYFATRWEDYLKVRCIRDGRSEPVFPANYDAKARDAFYKSLSFSGWGGSSGHDAPMIAYDALLGAGPSWTELCYRGMFHGGDSDSTGIIAGAMWGAIHGMETVPEKNHKELEYRDRLVKLADKIYAINHCPPEEMKD